MFKRLNITLADDVLRPGGRVRDSRAVYAQRADLAALEAFVNGHPSGDSEGGVRMAAPGGASVAAEAPVAYATSTAPTREQVADTSLERVGMLLRAFFSARGDVEAAWVFGSVARGTAGPMSDVDIAILPASGVAADAVWDLRLDLMSRLPGVLGVQEVDVVALPEAGAVLAHRAAIEGVRVFGESSRAAAEAEIAAMADYCDFAPVLRMLDARLSERLGTDGSR